MPPPKHRTPPKSRSASQAIYEFVGGVVGFFMGALFGAIATVAIAIAIEQFIPHAFGYCQGLACIHPVLTVFMPIGALVGGLAGVALAKPKRL